LNVLGRPEWARTGLESMIGGSIGQGNLPLAVAGCCELRQLGLDPSPHLDQIAWVFAKGSARVGEHHAKPPGLGGDQQVGPFGSELAGANLLATVEPIVQRACQVMQRVAAEGKDTKVAPQALFSALDVGALRATIEVFGLMTVAQDAAVIQERTNGTEAFVVARGELEVRRWTPEGRDLLLARLVGGGLFGEMALLSRAPRAASVVATRPSLILVATKESLEEVAAREPGLGVEIAAHCRRRMLENLLRTSGILAAVQPQDRTSLMERFVTRSYEPGERLIQQGEASDGLHLIASGEVVVSTREGTEDLAIAELGVGEVVGEVALVLRRPANADVTARLPTVTLHLPREEFLDLIRRHPALLAELYQLAIQRDEETSSIVAQEATLADDAVLV
jgi:cAMP-dependent protein kinase regulator